MVINFDTHTHTHTNDWLATEQSMQRDDDPQSDDLEGKILTSNPLLEAYGNAVTVRNNNSSRFGKWTVMEFNSAGMVSGCHIKPYLLEKSRVAFHTEGERNYHCFYHLFEAAKEDKDLLTSLDLGKTFNYLVPKAHAPEGRRARRKSRSARRRSIKLAASILPPEERAPLQDDRKYRQVRNAFRKIGVTAREERGSYEVLAGILHLGEVSFEAVTTSAGTEASKIKDIEAVHTASRILGIDKKKLAFSLTRRRLPGLNVDVTYNCHDAMDARDALAKALYGALFHWMIQKVNVTLRGQQQEKALHTIGVLDIFGFESFIKNGFEQLCINYSNEKLHFFFNEHVFRLEKVVYEKEKLQIDGNIQFVDNSPCLKMFENKKKGIFALLDDVSRLGESSDQQFLLKQQKSWKKSSASRSRLPEDADASFRVKHYAGEISYNVAGFLKRNADALHPDLATLVSASNNDFVNTIMKESSADSPAVLNPRKKKVKKPNKKSIGTKFKNALKTLIKMLTSTNPHFIRCLKPNALQKPKMFESPMVLEQLRQLGFLSVCQIRKNGFPVRFLFGHFWRLYQHCLPTKMKLQLLKNSDTGATAKACRYLVDALCNHIPTLGKARIQVGTTMVFMKDAAAQLLRQSRDKIV